MAGLYVLTLVKPLMKKERHTYKHKLLIIIADGAISDTHLRMLVDEIVIYEKNGKLDIQITLNGEFRTHIDYYDESGDITDRHAEIWYFPNWESMAEG